MVLLHPYFQLETNKINQRRQFIFLSSPLRFVADMVAWLALVLAERAHFEACLIAALGLQHSIGYGRRGRAAKLTKSLWERPQTIF